MSLGAVCCNVLCLMAISPGTTIEQCIQDLWFAQLGSLGEMVQSCHGNIENECWDHTFRGFDILRWQVQI